MSKSTKSSSPNTVTTNLSAVNSSSFPSSHSSPLPPSCSSISLSSSNSGPTNGASNAKSPKSTGANTPVTFIHKRSNHYESAAAALFTENILQLLPDANLTVVKEKLLDEDRIRGRILNSHVLGQQIFDKGLDSFFDKTIRPLKSKECKHPDPNSGIFSYAKFSKYDSERCTEIEMDCCVKVPVLADVEIKLLDRRKNSPMIPIECTDDNTSKPATVSSSSSSLSSATSSSTSSSSSSTALSTPSNGSTYASVVIGNQSTASSVMSSPSGKTVSSSSSPPMNPPKHSFKAPPTQTPSRTRKQLDPNFTKNVYPPGAITYLFAEIYASLSASTPDEFLLKLLQAERILCIIRAKENKLDIRECVLAFLFMGPSLDGKDAQNIFRTLEYYQKYFPNLWALQGNSSKPTRLFVQNVPYITTKLDAYSIKLSVDTLKLSVGTLEARSKNVEAQMNEQGNEIKGLRAQMNEQGNKLEGLQAQLDSIFKLLQNISNSQSSGISSVD